MSHGAVGIEPAENVGVPTKSRVHIPAAQAFWPEGFRRADSVAKVANGLTPEGVSYNCDNRIDHEIVGTPTFPK